MCEQRRNPSLPQVPKFGVANGMVPPPVPQELQGLTMAEEMMISRACPVVKVVRLAGGMHGYEGHVLSMGQDIGEFARRLPWLPNSDELPVVIIQPPGGGSWAGRNFKVSLRRVERALNYLVRHSPGYRDVVAIDMERVRSTLADLSPEAGGEVDVMHLFHTVTDEEGYGGGDPEGDGAGGGDDDGDGEGEEGGRRGLDYRGVERMPNPHDMDVDDPEGASGLGARVRRGPTESFVPSANVRRQSEEDAVREALMEMTGFRGNSEDGEPPTFDYPRRSGPVPENTRWLGSMCFPTLFPDGTADPFGEPGRRSVSLVQAIQHLMKFVDRPEGAPPHYRFASHRTFRYWALDVRLREQARTQCRVFLRNHEDLVDLDPSDIDDGTIAQLVRIAHRYVANVQGTDGYWMRWQGKLEEALNQLESLTTFTTYSAADHHWYDLFRLMPTGRREPPPGDDGAVVGIAERTRLLIDNPHIADWWIWERMKKFDEMFLGNDMAAASWFWLRAEWQSRASLHIHGCSAWACEAERRLTELSRTYLMGYIGRQRARREGGDPADNGGVTDEEYERVQQDIKGFLESIGFTARNPAPPAEDVPIGEETRREGREELERDLRNFPWDDVDACWRRYANLVNASQRHTKCGPYCQRNGRCRFGFPKARNAEMKLEPHPLTATPTDDPNDYQVIVTPPNAEGDNGPYDRTVNRHVQVQLLGWGANSDFSPIVDQGGATTYMVKYAAKGESSSREAQKMLITLVNEAAELPLDGDERLSLPQIMRKVMNCATTRRDMGVQEVMHMNLQMPMVLNNVEFVRAATQNTDVEVRRGAPEGGLRPVRGLLEAYAR